MSGCDPAARKAAYEQIQQILADEQPFTFLYTAKSGVFISKRLQNVQISPFAGATPFIAWGIRDWTVAN